MVAHALGSHSKAEDVVDGALRENPHALVPEDDVTLEFDNMLFWKRMSKARRYLKVCHAGWVGCQCCWCWVAFWHPGLEGFR